MARFGAMRERLQSKSNVFCFLDAAQLVKHALGLAAEGKRLKKSPVLLYLFAEPSTRGDRPITEEMTAKHRAEIAEFAKAVAPSYVRFEACSWREWLGTWTGPTALHAQAVIERFQP